MTKNEIIGTLIGGVIGTAIEVFSGLGSLTSITIGISCVIVGTYCGRCFDKN